MKRGTGIGKVADITKAAFERMLADAPRVEPRQPIGHVVKSHPQYFNEVEMGLRDFEVRVDDRNPRYETGDRVLLVEFDPTTETHTGRVLTREIGHVGRGGVFPPGYCAFALRWPTEQVCAPAGVLKTAR